MDRDKIACNTISRYQERVRIVEAGIPYSGDLVGP